jgi:hypothetical protein
MARQRRQLGALLPIAPSLALKYRAVEEAMNVGASEPATVASGAAVGASVAGTAADLAGGGMKLLACKVAAGVVCLGAGAGVGVSALEAPSSSQGQGTTATVTGAGALASAQGPGGANGWSATLPSFGGGISGRERGAGRHQGARTDSGLPVGATTGATAPGESGQQSGGTHDGVGSGQGGSGDSGAGLQHPGRSIRERGDPAGEREAQLQSSHERTRLRHEANERAGEERRRAHEAPKPPRSGSGAPTEQELTEKRERRKLKIERTRPEGHSKFTQETPEEHAERVARHKRRVEEKRKQKEEERRAEESAPAP